MININELRPGNYVQVVPLHYKRIIDVRDELVTFMIGPAWSRKDEKSPLKYGPERKRPSNPTNLDPIPLNEDIIKAFGFTLNPDKIWELPVNEIETFKIDPVHLASLKIKDQELFCPYLHTLQNRYFEFAQVDRIFNLPS